MHLEVILEGRTTRFVVVHYHIFKNGGSTIESILDREFPGKLVSLHGPTRDTVLDGNDLTEFLQKNPTVQAVTSHHLCYPKPAIPGIVLFDCCFLRHPLERVRSVYSYLRKVESDDPVCVLAHRHTPAEFVSRLIEKFPHVISNVQINRLVHGAAFTRPPNEADLETATRILLEMAIPGLVEMFDESLVAAEYFLRPAFPEIRLEYVPQNVSNPARREGVDREEKWLRLWGRTAYEELLRMNEFDVELYRRAEKEIDRRLSSVPKFADKLAEFRTRLDELQPGDRRQRLYA